jgi:chromosome segregation ATPase
MCVARRALGFSSSRFAGNVVAGAEEIRRLFDGEQKHVAEMRAWLQQKESLERDNDDATKQIEDLERELDNRNKELDKTKIEKESVEKTLAATKRHEEDLHERLTAAQQELGIRRVAEQTHKVGLSARASWKKTMSMMAVGGHQQPKR